MQTAASINLVATLAKLLPLGLFVVLAMMMFKLDTLQARLHRTCTWRTRVGTGEKHHADHPVGFIGVEGAVVKFLRVRVINVMLAKRHCWRFSPLWAFTCW